MSGAPKILSEFDFWKKNNWVKSFCDFDIKRLERLLREKDGDFWVKLGEKRALRLFHVASQRVPAYKDFLKKNRVNPEKIKTIKDFREVPVTDKKNYIKKYSLAKRCWDGKLSRSDIVAVSSGMSGESIHWPRGGFQEFEASVIHELLYRTYFDIQKRSTLLVICFPMGVYVSGVATLLPSWALTEKGYDTTVVSASNSKFEALSVVQKLQNDFEQIVLIGHPLLVKDVVETGCELGIQWKRMQVRMMFCSEGFSESWRQYVLRLVGASHSLTTAFSVYGSSDSLLMAYETPFSVFFRRLASRSARTRSFFGGVVPNLFQYNPFLRYIESIGGELLFTVATGIPLIRYNIHDSGEVISFGDLSDYLSQICRSWRSEFRDHYRGTIWRLPFVTLTGRSDHTIIFYAVNIYPEHVRIALEHGPFMKKLVGKFTMRKVYLKNMDEYLEINIELKKGVRPSKKLSSDIQYRIFEQLQKISSEFSDAVAHIDKDLRPRIKLWPYQHEKYFRPGLKPRYIL